MPITTPPDSLGAYGDDASHFQHILEHLFLPVITETGFQPIPPNAVGSDVIHAHIISNLNSSDLVLCDMSTLNPNVFFELGIRTALNKPACLIKDEVTRYVPFDASIVNYHTYSSQLLPWNIQEQKQQLKNHIEKTFSLERADNALWHYFAISHAAHLATANTGEDARFEYWNRKIEQLEYAARRIEQASMQNEDARRDAQGRPAHPTPPSVIPDMLRVLRERGVTDDVLADQLGIRQEILEGLRAGEVVPSPALDWKIRAIVSGPSGKTEQ
jgi:hypothetical protein